MEELLSRISSRELTEWFAYDAYRRQAAEAEAAQAAPGHSLAPVTMRGL